MPSRIQVKPIKGWRMPDNTIYVGSPSKWKNPYKVGDTFPLLNVLTNEPYEREINASHAKTLFKMKVESFGKAAEKEIISELKGKNLACRCKIDAPCHADVLLEIANKTIFPLSK
jgi:hypothetical protein